MTTIRVKENEPFDVALRRFKRTIEKLGLLTDLRAREFFEKPTAERKRKKAAARAQHAAAQAHVLIGNDHRPGLASTPCPDGPRHLVSRAVLFFTQPHSRR